MKNYFLIFGCFLFFNFVSGQDVPKLLLSSVVTRDLAVKYRDNQNRFAEAIDVHVSPRREGKWEYDGQKAIWKIDIQSIGAISLNLGFSLFHLPPNTELTIKSFSTQKIYGPFTPADNEIHNQLWTPIIPGDQLELKLVTTIAEKENIQLLLTQVNHGFVDFSRNGKISPCHVDAVCGTNDGFPINDSYRDQINAVGRMMINGVSFCSGVLINNARRDNTPYFLSAEHCHVNEENAPSVVVYWNFQNSKCRNTDDKDNVLPGDGNLDIYNTGSIVRAAYALENNPDGKAQGTDMLLLELDDPVNPDADVYFAGWNATQNIPKQEVAIHHPQGLEKRISINLEPTLVSPLFNNERIAPHFLEVQHWEYGITDPGSSGGPLFNEKKQVVGQLKSGHVTCDNSSQINSDWFGWLFYSWNGGGAPENQLKYWLDPDQTGILEMDGKPLASTLEIQIVDVVDVKCAHEKTGGFSVKVMGGEPPYQYQLNDFEFTTINIFSDLGAGKYEIKIIDRLGEAVSEMVEIHEPSPLQLNLFTDYDKITAKASGGAGVLEYSLDGVNFQDNPVFQVGESGTYTVYARDDNGCQISQSIEINFEPLSVELILEHDLKCFGDQNGILKAKITGGSQPYRIRLNAGSYEAATEFKNLGEGTYFVEVKDNANTLLRSNSIQLVAPEILDLHVLQKEQSNIEIQVNGGTSPYQYSLNNEPFQINNYFSNVPLGETLVKILDANLCSLDSMVTISMVSNTEVVEQSIFSILENPVQDYLQLEIVDNIRFPLQLDIYTIDGQGVFSKEVKNRTSHISLPVSNLNDGYYLLIVTNGYGLEVEKFIKIK